MGIASEFYDPLLKPLQSLSIGKRARYDRGVADFFNGKRRIFYLKDENLVAPSRFFHEAPIKIIRRDIRNY